MKLIHYDKVVATEAEMEGAKGIKVRLPISAGDGAPNFTMRIFNFVPSGVTPYHRHDYEQETFILSGRGKLLFEGGSRALEPGSVIFAEAGEWHGFVADEEGMEMLCVVPNRAYEPGPEPELKEWEG